MHLSVKSMQTARLSPAPSAESCSVVYVMCGAAHRLAAQLPERSPTPLSQCDTTPIFAHRKPFSYLLRLSCPVFLAFLPHAREHSPTVSQRPEIQGPGGHCFSAPSIGASERTEPRFFSPCVKPSEAGQLRRDGQNKASVTKIKAKTRHRHRHRSR